MVAAEVEEEEETGLKSEMSSSVFLEIQTMDMENPLAQR